MKLKLVNQTKFPQRGNCFRACLAVLLDIDINAMPAFEEQSDNVWIPAKRWLIEQGLTIRNYHKDFPPNGYSIATGQSPRNPNIHHAVVALDGVQYFDPHPDRSGLVSIERYWQIEQLEPVEEKFDDVMTLCSYPEMSHQERYEFRKNNKPSFNFQIDTIAIKIINESEQLSKLEETPKIQTIPSSSNVYTDLGFDNAEEMFRKAEIVTKINQILEPLSLSAVIELFPIYQDLDLGAICRGNFRNVDIDRLRKLKADLSVNPSPWEQN